MQGDDIFTARDLRNRSGWVAHSPTTDSWSQRGVAISLARQSEGASLIIDERLGRNVATHRNINIIGLALNIIFKFA